MAGPARVTAVLVEQAGPAAAGVVAPRGSILGVCHAGAAGLPAGADVHGSAQSGQRRPWSGRLTATSLRACFLALVRGGMDRHARRHHVSDRGAGRNVAGCLLFAMTKTGGAASGCAFFARHDVTASGPELRPRWATSPSASCGRPAPSASPQYNGTRGPAVDHELLCDIAGVLGQLRRHVSLKFIVCHNRPIRREISVWIHIGLPCVQREFL